MKGTCRERRGQRVLQHLSPAAGTVEVAGGRDGAGDGEPWAAPAGWGYIVRILGGGSGEQSVRGCTGIKGEVSASERCRLDT